MFETRVMSVAVIIIDYIRCSEGTMQRQSMHNTAMVTGEDDFYLLLSARSEHLLIRTPTRYRVSSNARTCGGISVWIFRAVLLTYQGRPRRDVNLHEILPVVPRKIRREISRIPSYMSQTSKGCIICVEDDSICSSYFDADTIVGERFTRMEIEYPQKSATFEDDHLVGLVL